MIKNLKEGKDMKEMYFTITGLYYQLGDAFIKPGMKVKLVKEPDNEFDQEAIMVKMRGLGKIGYVANSPKTVKGESYSAGRLYDKIPDVVTGTVLYALGDSAIGVIGEEDIFGEEDVFGDDDIVTESEEDHIQFTDEILY